MSPGPPLSSDQSLLLVRSGAFSGTAISLRDSLERAWPGSLRDLDTQALTRRPGLVAARAAAMVEARNAGNDVLWPKTASWSAGLDRQHRRAVAEAGAVVYVQTLFAPEPPRTTPYVVITDRVGREGAADSGKVTFSKRWLAREEAFLRGARGVFVLGSSTREHLVDSYGLSPDRVVVTGGAPNMVLPERTRPLTRCRRLLFVGTQWELKGGPALVEAFRRVRADVPDLELTVVGCSPSVAVDGVTVRGRLPHAEMDAVYEEHDAFVLPTTSEAFGLAFIEALYKGLPCLGTRIANIPGTIGAGGVVVDPGGDAPARVEDGLRAVLRDYDRLVVEAADRGKTLRASGGWDAVARSMCDVLLTGGR